MSNRYVVQCAAPFVSWRQMNHSGDQLNNGQITRRHTERDTNDTLER